MGKEAVGREMFFSRILGAVGLTIALQMLLIVILILVAECNIMDPVLWIRTSASRIFFWRFLIGIIPLILTIVINCILFGKYYVTPPPIYLSRFSIFINLFSTRNLVLSLIHAASGYMIFNMYGQLFVDDYGSIVKTCSDSDLRCISEKYLYLQLGGTWMGLYYFLTVYIFGSTMLTFPHIQQKKFLQMKMAFQSIISAALKDAIAPVVYYSVFYYVWGQKPRHFFMETFDLYLEDSPLTSFSNIFLNRSIVLLWFLTSVYFVVLYTMRTVLNIILTERTVFAITKDGCNFTLGEALAQKSHFMRMHAAQDLVFLAKSDKNRRLEVFSISQFGGHPFNWENVYQQSIQILKEFNSELDEINNNIHIPDGAPGLNINKRIPSGYPCPSGMRNMMEVSKEVFHTNLKNRSGNRYEEVIKTAVKNEANSLLKNLCQKPYISFFFGELSDCKLRKLLVQAHLVVWISEGLSFLAAASFNEDRHGAVQENLSELICILIIMKQNLDKLTKLGLVPRKPLLNDVFTIQMKQSLISAVKRSIYKLTTTFGDYMKDIPLSADVNVAIQPFLNFRES